MQDDGDVEFPLRDTYVVTYMQYIQVDIIFNYIFYFGLPGTSILIGVSVSLAIALRDTVLALPADALGGRIGLMHWISIFIIANPMGLWHRTSIVSKIHSLFDKFNSCYS